MKKILLFILLLLISNRSLAIAPITIDSIAGYPVSLCAGAAILYVDSTSGGVWSSSDTLIAKIDTSGIATGISAGTATITYSIDTTFVTKTVTVYPAPSPIFGVTTFCEGTSTTIYDTTAGGGYWIDDGPSGGGAYPAALGLYSSTHYSAIIGPIGSWNPYPDFITFTDIYGCSTMAAVNVDPLPPMITGNTNIYLDSTTTLNDSWTGGKWSSSSTTIATVDSTTGVVTGITQGTTTISYLLGCIVTTTLTVLPDLPIPIKPTTHGNEIVIYPNPSTTSLTITSSNPITQISITNLIGQTVYSRQFTVGSSQTVDVSGFAAGVYFVKVNGVAVRKFVKE